VAGKKTGGSKKAAQRPAQQRDEVIVSTGEYAPEEPVVSPSATVAAGPAGNQIDWIRVKFTPGPASEEDLLCWGTFGRRLDGMLEIILYTADETTALTECGTIYVERAKVVSFGYESSFLRMQEQHAALRERTGN
jgi:hypothetical protein